MLYDVLNGDLPFDADFVIDSICDKASIEPRVGYRVTLDADRPTDSINFFLEDTVRNQIILAGFVTSDHRIVIEAWLVH